MERSFFTARLGDKRRHEDREETREVVFTNGQQQALRLAERGQNVLITGSGGVGKSFVVREISKRLSARGKNIVVTGMTGPASIGVEGITFHKFMRNGLMNDPIKTLLASARMRKGTAKYHRDADVLIIDEISMLLPDHLEKADAILKFSRKNSAPMGGLQIIAVGDFGQLPPVNLHLKPGDPRFVFESPTWDKVIADHEVVELTEPMRQIGNRVFFDMLNRIRCGKHKDADIKLLRSRIDAKLPNIKGVTPTHVYPNNSKTDAMNRRELAKIKGEQMVFKIVRGSGIRGKGTLHIKADLVKGSKQLDKTNPTWDETPLKVGAQVMLTTNLDVSLKLANGTRGVVVGFTNSHIRKKQRKVMRVQARERRKAAREQSKKEMEKIKAGRFGDMFGGDDDSEDDEGEGEGEGEEEEEEDDDGVADDEIDTTYDTADKLRLPHSVLFQTTHNGFNEAVRRGDPAAFSLMPSHAQGRVTMYNRELQHPVVRFV